MAVDRGGLRYTIVVENEFSGPIADFRTGIAAAKKSWNDFKNTIKGSSAETLKSVKALNQLNAAVRRTARSEEAAANAAAKNLATKQAQARLNDRLLAQRSRLDQSGNLARETNAIRSQIGAVNQLATAYRRLAAAKAQAARLTQQANAPVRGGGVPRPLANPSGGAVARVPRQRGGGSPRFGEGAAGLSKFRNILASSQAVADRASFSFQRLFTVLAAFAAARFVVQGFTELVSRMVTFNSTIEKAQLGIASLFLAVGDVRDATGQTVKGAQGLAVAQAEARKQTVLLRRDALKTAATFEELLTAFQTGLAPGLQAGLSVDNIRKFTVQISQAAAAIGLPQNQLAEEIRSILSGNISSRNTRIATALGITNQDIKNAKTQGNLFGFLQQKFSAFTTAGEEALGTFDVLLANINEGLTEIIGTGGLEFFASLKTLLKEIFGTILRADPISGLITPNPAAIAAVKEIGAALTVAVGEARRVGTELGAGGALTVTRGIATFIELAAKTISSIVIGFVRGIETLRGIAGVVVDIFKGLTGIKVFDQKTFQDVFAEVVKIATVFLGLSGAAKLFVVALAPVAVTLNLIKGAVTGILGVARLLLGTLKTVGIIIGVVFSPLGLLVGLLFAVVEPTRRWLSELLKIDLTLISMVKTIKNGFIEAFAKAVNFFGSAFKTQIVLLQVSFQQFVGFIVQTALGSAIFVFEQLGRVNNASKKAAADLRAISKADVENRKEKIALLAQELDAIDRASKAEDARIAAVAKTAMDGIRIENDTNSFTAIGKSLLDGLSDEVNKILPNFELDKLDLSALDVTAPTEKAEKLSEIFKNLPGIIGGSRESIAGQGAATKELSDELLKTSDALRENNETLGLSGTALQQRQEILQAEVKIREATKKLDAEELAAKEKLAGVQRDIEQAGLRFNKLTAQQQGLVIEGVLRGEKELKNRRQIFDLANTLSADRAALTEATASGDAASITAAKEKVALSEQLLDLANGLSKANLELSNELVTGQTVENANSMTAAIKDGITLKGLEKTAEEEILAVQQDKLQISSLLNAQALNRIAVTAQSSTLELAQANRIAAIETSTARLKFESRFAPRDQQKVLAAESELKLVTAQVAQAQNQRDLNLDALRITLDRIKAEIELLRIQSLGGDTLEKRNAAQLALNAAVQTQGLVEKQIGATITANNLQRDEEILKLEEANETARQARAEIETPISTGILDGLRNAALELPTLYEGVVDGIKSVVTGLTDFISTSIVDAFDPTKDFDIKERFARFLQDIAKQVLQLFTQLAVARAIFGLVGGIGGGLPGAGGGGAGGISGILGLLFGGMGKAEGGFIAHRKAKGYAQGSTIRPAGLDPRDTVPIWAQPGEFMVKKTSARMYGAAALEAINQGLIDPYSLRALAGSVRSSTRSKGPGFAAGGSISKVSVPGRQSQGGGSRSPQAAYIVANDQQVERLMAGGKSAFFKFMQENRSKMAGILRS